MLCTEIVSDIQNNFCTQRSAKIRASDKDLPVISSVNCDSLTICFITFIRAIKFVVTSFVQVQTKPIIACEFIIVALKYISKYRVTISCESRYWSYKKYLSLDHLHTIVVFLLCLLI